MSIQKIKELICPPAHPFEAGNLEQWLEVEQKLGLSLPSDFRDFVLTYGTGRFAKFYVIYSPFSTSEYSNLYWNIEWLCKTERQFKRDWPETVPYLIYPDRPGLLPWGGDDNGNYYFWLMDGPPDTWQVISNEVRGEGYREYGRCMTDFLFEILTGKIQALAGDYPREEHRVFETWETLAKQGAKKHGTMPS